MKKIILPVLIIGLIFVSIFLVRPLAFRLLNRAATSETTAVLGSVISINPAAQLSIIQGFSDQAMVMHNISDKPVKVNLGHAHGFLTLEPKSETLAPGASREITMHIDDFCPSGKIDLLVFLLAEVDGHTFGMETFDLEFNVLSGELILSQENNQFMVTWNNNPAPPGVILYYRDPEGEDQRWLKWGETPQLSTPTHFKPDIYTFDFKAKLGETESAVVRFEIYVDEEVSNQQPETATQVAAQTEAKEDKEDAAPENVSSDESMTHRIEIIEAPENIKDPAQVIGTEEKEVRREWWQSN